MADSEITIDLSKALRKTYSLRATGREGRTIEVSLPREVVEREARNLNILVSAFLKDYEAECFYNGFEGVLVKFKRKT